MQILEEVNSEIGVGVHVEMEHLRTYEWLSKLVQKGHMPPAHDFFEHIALDHLSEDPEYYKKLKQAQL